MSKLSQGANGIPHGFVKQPIANIVPIGGIAKSGTSGSFAVTSSTPADVTNSNVILTTTGRSVEVRLMGSPDTSNAGYIGIDVTGNAPELSGRVIILRDSAVICTYRIHIQVDAANIHNFRIPSSSVSCIDFEPPAGQHLYKAQAALDAGGANGLLVFETILVAREI